MKKLTFLTKESVFGGYIQTCIAELVDCLAVSLSDNYSVSIVCYGCQHSLAERFNAFRKRALFQKTRLMKVDYYFIEPDHWEQAFLVVENIQPDIVHILSAPEDIDNLITRPKQVLFTFSKAEKLINTEEFLKQYDAISSTSNPVLETAKQIEGVKDILEEKGAVSINNGLLTDFFTPEKGILLIKSYSAQNLSGKESCKHYLEKTYGIPTDCPIFVTGNLRRGASIKKIIDIIPTIQAIGGFLIIATKTTPEEEIILKQFKIKDRVLYLGSTINFVKLPMLLAGSDFYIQPDDITLGSFTAMAASQYGTVPIVSLKNPELADKFDDSNAIIVYNEDYESAIYSAVARPMRLMRGPDRKVTGMMRTCSWNEQKQLYIDLYEK